MRDIRFRAWDKEAKEMYHNVQNHIGPVETAFGGMLKNDRYIFEQYTELMDKHGKLIYEGDIIEMDDDNGVWVSSVVFTRGLFGFDVYKAKQIRNPEEWDLPHNKTSSRSWACQWGYEESGTAFTHRVPLAKDTTFRGGIKDYEGSEMQKRLSKYGHGSYYMNSGEVIGNIHESPDLLA